MANNAIGDSAFTQKVTCTTSDQSLDMLTTRNTVAIVADGDCFINFDKAVTTTGRYLIKANTPVDLHDLGGVRVLHYLDAGGSANIYVLATKSR